MDMLRLAIKARLPLIHVRTEDTVNVKEVLSFLAGNDPKEEDPPTKVVPINIEQVLAAKSNSQVVFPEGDIFYTSAEVGGAAAKLYRIATDAEKTIIFVNGQRSPLMFDGGMLVPPKDLMLYYLDLMGTQDPQELLPAFGGLTLKDMGEVARLTMTRDEALTVRGINATRRGYSKLQGITQVDTAQKYYIKPKELEEWLAFNAPFFQSEHLALRPRGLLFDGPPGTGKTEAAKAIATELGVALYRLDLGTMMGKYVGDSEGNLNAALQQIDEVEPCVVIFDEVEKVFRGMSSDSGVTSRMLSQLLWWLQSHETKVFTVMTTNDIKAIPKELYREGRIDRTMEFLGIGNFTDAYNFARGAMIDLLKELGKGSPGGAYMEELSKRIKKQYSGEGTHVPQAKLVSLVNGLVKEIMTGAVADNMAEGEGSGALPSGKTVLKLTKKS
jgi:hypothetical protein